MSIEDNNIFYNILRRYMNAMFRTAFSRIEYVGLEKIPRDGALIFAPNHTNALMDALTVLTVNGDKVVFVSRADIFRKKAIARILNFFKIMPIMRRRDGLANIKKNDEIMDKAVHVLCSGVPFCIFSEGTHRMMHSTLPLTKGIFRIALQCVQSVGDSRKVYVTPLGIEYGSYTSYRHSLLVTVGDPIDVSQFVGNHTGLDYPELINALRPVLAERMSQLIHHIPEQLDYEAVLDLSYLQNSYQRGLVSASDTLYNRMQANRATVAEVERLTQSLPGQTEQLLSVMHEFAAERRRLNITDATLYRLPTWGRVALNIVLAVIALPYAVCCMAVNAPETVIQSLLTYKLDDRAFANSFRFAVVMLITPIVVAVVAVLAFVYLPTMAAATVVLLSLPANIVANDYIRLVRNTVSHIRFLRSRRLNALLLQAKQLLSSIRNK